MAFSLGGANAHDPQWLTPYLGHEEAQALFEALQLDLRDLLVLWATKVEP
jgi:hypothetical protein